MIAKTLFTTETQRTQRNQTEASVLVLITFLLHRFSASQKVVIASEARDLLFAANSKSLVELNPSSSVTTTARLLALSHDFAEVGDGGEFAQQIP